MASSNEGVATASRTADPVAPRTSFRVPAVLGFKALGRRRQGALVPATPALPGVASRPRLRLGGGFGVVLSWILAVLIPTAAASWYFGFVASPIYVSEAKFAVRGTVEKLADSPALAMMTQLTKMNSNQDAYIVADYIGSLPLIEKVQRENDIRKLYGRPDADFWARLPEGVSAEKLRTYWGNMVKATVDNLSGVVTVQVRAFTPEDALAVTKTILAESEKLVNEMSVRRNEDTVRYAKHEVDRAEDRIQKARLGMQAFRNSSGTLDPVKEAEATFRLAMVLRSERISLENEVMTARRTLSETAPSVQILNSRLVALKDQIANVERTLTGTDGPGTRTASASLYRYEGLELERMFAEKIYLMAQAALEKARETAIRQGIYLVTFVEPALAELPLFPRRASEVWVVFACCFGVWSVIVLLTASVRDHNS